MALRLHRAHMPELPTLRTKRNWRDNFIDAVHGAKTGIRGQSSFFVHFFATTLVIVTGIVVQCDIVEWCILAGGIGLVIVAELFNSAIKILVGEFDATRREQYMSAFHIAAGAVLIACSTTILVCVLVLGRRMSIMLAG